MHLTALTMFGGIVDLFVQCTRGSLVLVMKRIFKNRRRLVHTIGPTVPWFRNSRRIAEAKPVDEDGG